MSKFEKCADMYDYPQLARVGEVEFPREPKPLKKLLPAELRRLPIMRSGCYGLMKAGRAGAAAASQRV
jgi:hypothetical protein